MERSSAAALFECLASPHRLEIFRLLVRHAPTGLVAGEIGSHLGLPPTNLSFHLKTLSHAGLVTASQEGRFQRYRAELPLMSALIDYLTAECCQGNPAACVDVQATDCCTTPTKTAITRRRAGQRMTRSSA